MPQMILHLTRSNRLWTFQLLGFELLQKKRLQLIISKFCVNMLYSIFYLLFLFIISIIVFIRPQMRA
jgi:hypothetical protein